MKDNKVPEIKIFTLNDFYNIKNNGFDYIINDETNDIIQALSKEVGAPNYVRTPIFKSLKTHKNNNYNNHHNSHNNSHNNYQNLHNFKHKNRRHRNHELLDDDEWENIKNNNTRQNNFIEKSLTQKVIENMRLVMNKLTENNENEKTDELYEQLKEFENNDEFNEEQFMNEFYKLCYLNSMNCLLNARVYCNIAYKFNDDMLNNYYDNWLRNWRNSFKEINYFDENENYDLFCNENEKNDERLKQGKFLLALKITTIINNKEGNFNDYIVTSDLFDDMVKELLEEMEEIAVDKNNRYITEEYGKMIDEIYNLWSSIVSTSNERILNMTLLAGYIYNLVNNNYKGLSGKTKFLLMNILDDMGYDNN